MWGLGWDRGVAGQGAQPDLLVWPSWASPVLRDSSECFQVRAKGRISGLLLEVTPVTPMGDCTPVPVREYWRLLRVLPGGPTAFSLLGIR